MGKTISTHNGSSAHRDHNIRNPKATDLQGHIDKALSGQNEILLDEKPREAYKRIFGEALERYNAKQTRPDREIRDYYNHICKDEKKHPVYEMIVQIGDRNDTGIDAPVERECLKEFFEGWKERNPNLECIGAYIHADESEGTLHMHLDYIPVATGYKRGLEVQNGLVKALELQGFKKDKEHPKTAQIQWEARENAVLESICNSHGIEVVHPERDKKKHLDTEIYKAQSDLENAREELEIIQDVTDKTFELKAIYEEEASKAQDAFNIIDQETSILEVSKSILERDIKDLEQKKGELEALIEQKAKLEQELPSLQEKINDAEDELEAVRIAIKREISKAEPMFRSGNLSEKIAEAKEEARIGRFARRFERFLDAHPKIRQIFDAWDRADAQQTRTNRPRKRDDGHHF